MLGMSSEIGGYFSLELNQREKNHSIRVVYILATHNIGFYSNVTGLPLLN